MHSNCLRTVKFKLSVQDRFTSCRRYKRGCDFQKPTEKEVIGMEKVALPIGNIVKQVLEESTTLPSP
ncbi:hypothetical protein MLD38_023122 [Melastoma candidum]|uniref:Uncharacterized protein n=1 Tax=Melastoma candidum TaxID=119954 RepID=A0ACB9QLE1_9MYRT|nr:hypothetical protein MLD38_023122 [Melastoma candidum]